MAKANKHMQGTTGNSAHACVMNIPVSLADMLSWLCEKA